MANKVANELRLSICASIAHNRRAAKEIERLQSLVDKGHAVVKDFMPNLGACASQDLERLNSFLMETKPDS